MGWLVIVLSPVLHEDRSCDISCVNACVEGLSVLVCFSFLYVCVCVCVVCVCVCVCVCLCLCERECEYM